MRGLRMLETLKGSCNLTRDGHIACALCIIQIEGETTVLFGILIFTHACIIDGEHQAGVAHRLWQCI